MKYMGSKNRVSRYILPIILSEREEKQWYVEPFVGGGNMIDKVQGKRIGSDINPYLIALLQEMQKETFRLPDHISERKYRDIRQNKEEYPAWVVGYTGICLSFGAKFFGGYRRDKAGIRNYENEAKKNIQAQQNSIKDIVFICCDYTELTIPDESLIYCDPPYKGTTQYRNKFDSDAFYDWCIQKKEQGHNVFVSEYNMDSRFECIWEKEVSSNLTVDTKGKVEKERLFRVKSNA